MNTQIEVMVLGNASRFRDSIHLLLASVPRIEKIYLADKVESALRMKESPAVVVVDDDVANGRLPVIIEKLKTGWPRARLIILVEDERQFQSARTAGADHLLRKGFRAATFIETVETLLARGPFLQNTHPDRRVE